jgi:hypothetical protein
MSGDDRSDSPEDGAADLVRFFRALSPVARRDYAALVEMDLAFGEDVTAERRASGGSVKGA